MYLGNGGPWSETDQNLGPRVKVNVSILSVCCSNDMRTFPKMAAGGHLGFSVFHRISKTAARRGKRMKIWAHRVKVSVSILSVCGTNNMRTLSKMAAGRHLGFSVFSETAARRGKLTKI